MKKAERFVSNHQSGYGQAFESTPTEIDGMDVLFDKRVTLFPVALVEPERGARPNRAGAKAMPRGRR